MHLYVGKLLQEPVGSHLQVELALGFQDLADDLSVQGIRGELTFLRTSDGIMGYGALIIDIEIECARCLEPILHPLNVDLEEFFSPAQDIAPDKPAFPIDADGYIDLGPILCDLVIVSTPMHVQCKPDCKGLCPNCGVNLNNTACDCETDDIDPRMAVLRSWTLGEERTV